MLVSTQRLSKQQSGVETYIWQYPHGFFCTVVSRCTQVTVFLWMGKSPEDKPKASCYNHLHTHIVFWEVFHQGAYWQCMGVWVGKGNNNWPENCNKLSLKLWAQLGGGGGDWEILKNLRGTAEKTKPLSFKSPNVEENFRHFSPGSKQSPLLAERRLGIVFLWLNS